MRGETCVNHGAREAEDAQSRHLPRQQGDGHREAEAGLVPGHRYTAHCTALQWTVMRHLIIILLRKYQLYTYVFITRKITTTHYYHIAFRSIVKL